MFKNFNPLRPILAILILFIPLYPKFPLANVSGTYVAIRLDDIIIFLAILALLINQIKNKFNLLKEPVTKLFLAYFVAIITSFILAYFVYKTDPPQILILNLLRRFEYISVFFLTIATLQNSKSIKFTYIFLLIATAAVIVYGYGQKYYHLPVVSTMNSEFSKGQLLQLDTWTRISSTFAGHYDFAVFLSIVLIIIGGVAVTQTNLIIRFTNILIWLPAFHMLTLTASRVSVFAFYGGMCLALILLKKYYWIIPVTIIFGFSILNSKDLNQRLIATIPALKHQLEKYFPAPTTAPIAVVTSNTPSSVPVITTGTTPAIRISPVPTIIRHQSTEEVIPIDADVGVARSGEIRFNVEWPRAINAFRKNIINGTGLGSITLATDNDYLRILGESGLVGFITFFGIFLYFLLNSVTSNKTITILACALITFLFNATLIDVFEASKTAYLFWIMMGIYYHLLRKIWLKK